MISKGFLLLVLLGSVASDRLRFHLEHLVDRNVSACDDFYHHMCSQSADPKEFFTNRVMTLFEEATRRFLPDALRNSPISYDLERAKVEDRNLKDNKYGILARERCKDDIDCYIDDQGIYSAISTRFLESGKSTFIDGNKMPGEMIREIVADTSALIDKMILELPDFESIFDRTAAVYFFNVLQSRTHMIEFMQSNSTFGDFHEICDIGETMKAKMIENIEASKWLHGDEISNSIREKIKERIASIHIYHDFDELDRNMTMMGKLNRDLNRLYFSNQRKTGVIGLDALVGLKLAYKELKSMYQNSTEEVFIDRIYQNFGYNAFFLDDSKTVTMLAPFLYREAFQSEILKEPFITYSTLGHELYHSLFSPFNPSLLALYDQRGKCIVQHYENTCSKFAMGACKSGKKTITEDGSDLESYRLLYRMLTELYTDRERNAKIDGLETTLEQAFFYYAAGDYCEKDVDRSEYQAEDDVHSAGNIRVNGAYSLMPEFTKAFGCKEGDAMYIEEEKSCYVFGPNS